MGISSGEQKPGTQPRRLRAQREHGGHAPSVPDPAGRDHRHRRHRVHDGGHQWKRRHLAPHVSPRLPPLRHDDIDSAGDRPPRLFGAADRLQNDSVGVVDLLDVAGGIPPEQRHDPQAGFEGLVEATVLIGGENQIAAEGTIGERRRLANHVSGRVDHVSVNMPSAPAFETAAASSGTAAIGAWTIGCSIPSSSQTGVRIATARSPSPRSLRRRISTYDSYDVGVDSGARLFHP